MEEAMVERKRKMMMAMVMAKMEENKMMVGISWEKMQMAGLEEKQWKTTDGRRGRGLELKKKCLLRS